MKLDESQLTIGKIAYQILTAEGVTDVAWAQFFKLLFSDYGSNKYGHYFNWYELRDSIVSICDEIEKQETAILRETTKEPEPEQTYENEVFCKPLAYLYWEEAGDRKKAIFRTYLSIKKNEGILSWEEAGDRKKAIFRTYLSIKKNEGILSHDEVEITLTRKNVEDKLQLISSNSAVYLADYCALTFKKIDSKEAYRLIDEWNQQKEPEPEQTYAVGDYFKFCEPRGKQYERTYSNVCKIISTHHRWVIFLWRGRNGDCGVWSNNSGLPLTKVNDINKITQAEFDNISKSDSGYKFTKITKSEAESIVGHALD